jgi:signal transduction histidine kinase
MFKSAKIKLTLWYIAILTIITVSFSAFVYTNVVSVTNRALEAQRTRLERRFNEAMPPTFRGPNRFALIDPETLLEIRERTFFVLVAINLIILGLSGALSYFLAGRTLKPIEEMLEKQKRFVSDAAHELRTPLTAMKADLEVTQRDKKLDLEKAKKSLSNAITEINNLNALVNKLLSHSKYQNAFRSYEKKTSNISEIINLAVKEVDGMAKEKNIYIEEHLINVEISADRDSLQGAFRNLFENAVKYSPENNKIVVACVVKNNDVIINIVDYGTGIPSKDQSKIFEPFYRSDKSRSKNNIGGFGLGLAISKEIVENHGGSIEVKSKLGEGSTFTITLPLAKSKLSGNSQIS